MSMIMLLERIESEDAVAVTSEAQANVAAGGEERFGLRIADTGSEEDHFDEFDDDFDEDDSFDDEDFELDVDPENSISLEKAWHGLHFLLAGDAWGGVGHAAFLLTGGRPVGEDTGYGPSRLITSEEVLDIHHALQQISSDDLWARFDSAAWQQADIYAFCPDETEEELAEEYLEYFESLKEFVAETATCNSAIRITLT